MFCTPFMFCSWGETTITTYFILQSLLHSHRPLCCLDLCFGNGLLHVFYPKFVFFFCVLGKCKNCLHHGMFYCLSLPVVSGTNVLLRYLGIFRKKVIVQMIIETVVDQLVHRPHFLCFLVM